MNLRRLPPHKEPDQHNAYFCFMVAFCGHAYAFKDHNWAHRRMLEFLSWYEACIRVATSNYVEEEDGGREEGA